MLTGDRQQVPPLRPQAHLKFEIVGGGFPTARDGWVELIGRQEEVQAWPRAESGALGFGGTVF